MGAALTEQVAAGKTPNEAYRRAVDQAEAYYGHQEGYSGAINSKASGFVPVELPARFTYQKFQSLLEDLAERDDEYLRERVADAKREVAAKRRGSVGRLRKAEQDLRKEQARIARAEKQIPASLAYRFDSYVETYYAKWDAPLCVELKGAEAKRYGNVQKKRGERLYIFFGYAPS